MTTTSSAPSFADRVQEVLAGMEATGLIDRFAANDVLLDLLDAAGTDDEQARVLAALADLPKSNLVDRAQLTQLLRRLSAPRN